MQNGDNPSINAEERITEGKKIIENLSRLKYEMGRDHSLE
jgi:hypothetical protein